MSVPLLDVSHVGMTYVVGGLLARRVVRAVDGVSLRLEAGRPEILAVIGESGSGKTTLARMILNLAQPTDGAIRFLGADVTRIRGNRARANFMRLQPADFGSGEAHDAAVGGQESVDDIEQRGLAGAVRTDDAVDRAFRHRQCDALDRLEAAERARHIVEFENGYSERRTRRQWGLSCGRG